MTSLAAAERPSLSRTRSLFPGLTFAVWLVACSSSPGNNSQPSSSTAVSGAVVDAFVINATVTAYEVSPSGVVGACVPATPATTPSSCATATTDSSGNYTINLGSYSGAVLLESTGGSYTDTVTGQTVPIPSSVTLSSFVASVSPGSGPVTAQVTGLTTIAANIALEEMGPPQNLSATAAAAGAASLVQNYFGLQNLGTTALVDLASPNCNGPGVSQANFDASLILAGLAQLAQQFGVSTIDLTNAIIADFSSNGGVPTGLNAGGDAITIGNTTITLAQVEGSSLGQSLETAIETFIASVANACKATQSSGQKGMLGNPAPPSQTCASAYYCYSATINYTGPANVDIIMGIGLTCQDDHYGSVNVGFRGGFIVPSVGSNTSLTIAATAGKPGNYAGSQNFDYLNDCGTNGATVELAPHVVQPVNCTFNPSKLSFTSSDNGYHNTATSSVTVVCTPATYTVGGSVSGLPSGASLKVGDTVNGDNAVVTANGAFTLPAQLGVGTPYSIAVLTQPTGLQPGKQCIVGGGDDGHGNGTINGPVTNVLVTCPLPTPPVKLNGENGLAFQNGLLYVANYGGDQVLVFNEEGSGSSFSLNLFDVIIPGSGLATPTRLAFDPAGRYLFVTYGHQGAVGAVGVYDTQSGNAQVSTISDNHIVGPLGVAVDKAGNVYIAENTTNSVSVFTPKTPGDPSAGYSWAFDVGGLSAPGALAFHSEPNGQDYLLVGLITGTVDVYPAPLSRTPTTVGMVTCGSGVTGIALSATALYVTYYSGDAAGYNFSGALPSGCPSTIGIATGLSPPEGIAVDANGNVIVANAGKSQLVVYGPSLGSPIYTYGP